jgi:glycosyltransferase involved in cell wall biosynthesis
VLIFVGGLEPEYDLPLQIEALGFVRKNFPEAGLILIGSGSLEQEVRSRIRAQPHAAHILLCGDVPHSFTLKAISQAHVMLRTTLYDGDAISVREALHLGTPVIATDNGMRPAGVRLIPKSDLPALVRAIDETLEHPAPRTPPESGDDSNLQAVLQVYEQLLSRKA